MTYTELKKKHAKEFNAFPMAFAFSQKQLEKGLLKLNTTIQEVISIGGGGFIRKTDKDAFLSLFNRHEQELKLALQDDGFLLGAIEHELHDHEFCITYDLEDALSAIGVSLEDERVRNMYKIALKNY